MNNNILNQKPEPGGAAKFNIKDIFPQNTRKLFVYKGTQSLHKGRNVFAKEGYDSIIQLEFLGEIDGIVSEIVQSKNVEAIEEAKEIREIEMVEIFTFRFTTINNNNKIDLTQNDLFFTTSPFYQGPSIDFYNKNVFLSIATTFGTLQSLLINPVPERLASAAKQKSITLTLSIAYLQNNLPSSRIGFMDKRNFNIPTENEDFEITKIIVESNNSFFPEFGNWFKAKGVITLTSDPNTKEYEKDISFKQNLPFLPLRVTIIDKEQKNQIIVRNFLSNYNMTWYNAKKFLTSNKSLRKNLFGRDANDALNPWEQSLLNAILDMLKLNLAFNNGFIEYRDQNSGEISKTASIGGISLRSLENKLGSSPQASEVITQILKNWEIANPQYMQENAYILAKQILVAIGHVMVSNYTFGKVISDFNKTELDWYLEIDELGPKLTKDSTDINFKLKSLRYEFNTNDSNNPKIKGIKMDLNKASNIIIDNNDRFVSLPTLDNPIKTSNFYSNAGDFELSKIDSLNYFIGANIKEPNDIENFHINTNLASASKKTINENIDTMWFIRSIEFGNFNTQGIYDPQKFNEIRLKLAEHYFNGIPIYDSLPYILGSGQTDDGYNKWSNQPWWINFMLNEENRMPLNSYNFKVNSIGTHEEQEVTLRFIHTLNNNYFTPPREGYFINRASEEITFKVKLWRYKGASISYDLFYNKPISYQFDKTSFINKINYFSNNQHNTWKRTLIPSDEYLNDAQEKNLKILEINSILISAFLPEFINITFEYKFTETKDNVKKTVTKQISLPKIELVSEHDETITKHGIKF